MAKNKRNRNYRNNNRNSRLQAGDKLYYNALNRDDNKKVSEAIRMTTKSALEPYYNFLNEAIKAEEKKGSYEIDWKPLKSNFSLNIFPIYSKFKIEKPKTVFKIFLEDEDILKDTRNRILFDEQDEIVRFDKENIKIKDNLLFFERIDFLPKENEIIEINNIEVKYELQNINLKNGNILESGDEDFRITDLEELSDGWNILLKTNKNIKELKFQQKNLNISKYPISFENLFDGEDEYQFEKLGNEYKSDNRPTSKILKDENGFEYSWRENRNQNKQDIVIQLIDDDSNDDKSISDYFLADEVRAIYQGKDSRNGFDIKAKKIDDKILILRQDWKNPKELKKDEPIKIKVETGNLKKQRDTVKLLNNSPVKAQKNLIKLFERKSSRLWEYLPKQDIEDWYILKDESFDGTIDQREFVKKAIATDDFSILEGPPGSGKTTTILELILQLTKLRKKILLSASTHVAIDNVLERIEKYDIDKTVEPLRIGRSESVGEAINHLQIDKKIENYENMGFNTELAKKLILDSSNLVCGTTMGINQFPTIKDRDRNSDLPMDTIFDYMIIDESSKTTFQEFLVPAMLAKKWILVGDIKQLSPFIEQSHIVHNFNVVVHKDIQKAIRIVFETLYNNPNPYIVEVSINEEREIKKYLDSWEEKEENPYENKIISYSNEKDLFKILGSDLILVKDGSWNSVKNTLPKTHIVILKNDANSDDFWFKQNYLNKKRKLQRFQQINREFSKINSPIEYKNFFKTMLKDKSWADEIAWRMIRVYERRMLKNPNSYYEKTYELLKPVDKDNAVERIYNMTLPSILESIQVGNKEKNRNETTITHGFDKRDLRERHETLKTQHRMAPDISKFSRENFYTVDGIQALKNAQTINREWNYERYNNRAVWLDTPKSDKDKNSDRRHKKEADIIVREIESFLKFIKQNPKNQDDENWSIAVLTFYKPQESLIRENLRKFCNQPNKMSRFSKESIDILLYTVDKFQGMEADIVFLSMVRGKSIGFMDNINRLNVALTRAKYQRVIVGDREFFKKQRGSEELRKLTQDGDKN